MVRLLCFYTGILLTLGVASCNSDSGIRFEHPQPLMTENEEEIASKLWGEYLNVEDSSSLQITATSVVHYEKNIGSFSLQELKKDTVAYKIERGWFYSSVFPKGLQVQKQALDSLFLVMPFVDTIFTINAKHRLRKFKGVYLLNKAIGANQWKVICLNPSGRKKLQLQYLDDSLDLTRLQDIHSLRKIDQHYLANPSQKELRQFIRQGGFRRRENYVRVSDSLFHLRGEVVHF